MYRTAPMLSIDLDPGQRLGLNTLWIGSRRAEKRGNFMKSWRLALLGLALGAATACTENSSTADRTLGSLGFKSLNSVLEMENVNPEAVLVRIVDNNGSGISGATVLIGGALNDPFPGNQLTTDANGYATPPAAWKSALPLTVEATGFVRTTFLPVSPGQIQLQLRVADSPTSYQISGQTQGFGDLRTDGKVDFGLVIPAIHKSNILQFDVGNLVSPEVDSISVVGRTVEIPSNITLPQQRESYIFPITLNKPNYRMYVRQTGNYNMVAMHGQFPLQTVVDELRAGKSMFEMIRHFTFLSAGVVQTYVGDSGLSATLSVNDIPFNQPLTKVAPSFPAGHMMMAVALADDGNYLYPTDVKTVQSGGSVQLNGASGKASNILSILRADNNLSAQNATEVMNMLGAETFNLRTWIETSNRGSAFGQLSFVLQPAYDGTAPQFLDLVPEPYINGQTISLTPPAQLSGVKAVATLAIYSEIEETGGEKVKTERRTRIWEVVTPGWSQQLDLPSVALNPDPNKKYRWEVLFLGRTGSGNFSNPLEGITHVTRNAINL